MKAYGIRVEFDSDSASRPMTADAPRSWLPDEDGRSNADTPTIRFVQKPGEAPSETSVEMDSRRALLRSEGRLTLEVRRNDRTVVCTAPSPISREEVLHPLLAFVGAAYARWASRTALHAATVVIAGRSWVLLGAATGGKSSMAAAMHARGFVVLTDDLTVIESNATLTGVRVADLRETPRRLGLAAREVARAGQTRWRIELGAAPAEVELGGFVQLEWGDSVSLRHMDAAARLTALASNDALLTGPAHPTSFLDLTPFPFFALRRPRSWSDLDASIDLLVAHVS